MKKVGSPPTNDPVVGVGVPPANGPVAVAGIPPVNEVAGGVGGWKVGVKGAVGSWRGANGLLVKVGLAVGMATAAAAVAAIATAIVGGGVVVVDAVVAAAARWRSDSTMEGLVGLTPVESWMRRIASAMVIGVPLMLIMAGGLVPSAEEEGAVDMEGKGRLIGRAEEIGANKCDLCLRVKM